MRSERKLNLVHRSCPEYDWLKLLLHLTSAYLLDPEQSTSAIVVHHPDAKYFVV